MRSIYRLGLAIVCSGAGPDRRISRRNPPLTKRFSARYFTLSNSAFACAWQNGGSYVPW